MGSSIELSKKPYYNVGKVMVSGDWHGNIAWASALIHREIEKLADEQEKLIFQLGDFGFWAGKWGQEYIEQLTHVLDEVGAHLFFIDGNHENHQILRKAARMQNILDQQCPVFITDRITWMQRGSRAKISGREWLFLGGAASVDRDRRTENVSWFPEERITQEQVNSAIAGGPADVMLSHDCPAMIGVTFPEYPKWPLKDLALSQVNRDYLDTVIRNCGIEYVMHGHLHMAFEITTAYKTISGETKDIRVNCFHHDGMLGNWGILDTQTMKWTDGG